MIGLGKWKCTVNHAFYNGCAYITIKDNNGEYAFELDMPEFDKMPEYSVEEITENGNRLEAVLKIKILPTKMTVVAEFDGDTMNAKIKIPFVGDIKIENAQRVN